MIFLSSLEEEDIIIVSSSGRGIKLPYISLSPAFCVGLGFLGGKGGLGGTEPPGQMDKHKQAKLVFFGVSLSSSCFGL